jgi:YD repeat protein
MALGGFVGTLSIAGGPVTMILVGSLAGAVSSAGMSMITQKAQKGSFEWKEVAKDAAIGAVVGGITGGIGGRIMAGARDVAGVTPKVGKLASKVAEKTDWKWADNLIRKAVDYKPWTSLKGTAGVADDVAMMAPARETKEFLSHQVGQFLKPGQHTMLISRGWWRNQAVSQLTTSQPLKHAAKYAVKHTVDNFVPTLSAGVTSLRHQVEEAPHNQQNGNG